MSMKPCQIRADFSGEDDYLSLKSTDGLGGRRHGGLSRDRVVVFHDRCVTVTSARLDSRREIVLTLVESGKAVMNSATTAREDVQRVSIDTINDWKRIKSNFSSAAFAALDEILEASGGSVDKDALLPHVDQVWPCPALGLDWSRSHASARIVYPEDF
jgi:hypothetical protein